MKLTDLTGEVHISAHHAKSFVSEWFRPEDKIVIMGQRSEKTGNMDTISQSLLASEISDITDDDLRELVFTPDGSKWNLYVGVCPIKEDVELQRRGKEDNILRVPGVWADLDVKNGCFESREDIIQYLFGTIELPPSIVVASGSGGVHAYWKLAEGEEGSKDLAEYWWSYLDESAGDIKIDKLADLARVLRLPGSVYFPKKDSGSKVGKVEIMYLTGKEYTVKELHALSKSAYDAKMERRRKLISSDANRRVDMDRFARDLLSAEGNRWTMYRAISELEDYVNQRMDWSQILEPYGWTFMRHLSDGSNEWARPGRSERSAVVDYEGSPVMSLLSSSEETNLADLKDAHLPLTKYRVYLRLHFNDDEQEMVKHLIGKLKEEGII